MLIANLTSPRPYKGQNSKILLDFFSLKHDVNEPSKRISEKHFLMCFLLASWRSMTKIAGSRSESGSESGSRSITQRHGSASTPKCPGSGTLVWRRTGTFPLSALYSFQGHLESWSSAGLFSASGFSQLLCFVSLNRTLIWSKKFSFVFYFVARPGSKNFELRIITIYQWYEEV